MLCSCKAEIDKNHFSSTNQLLIYGKLFHEHVSMSLSSGRREHLENTILRNGNTTGKWLSVIRCISLHADCPHFTLLLCFCPPSHIISGSFPVSSAPPLAILLLMYSANYSFLYSTTSSPQYSLFFYTCSPDTFLCVIFSDMKIFLILTVCKSLLFPTWNLTPSQSIFITLILSLVAHIPIQNCLSTILSWLKYKLIRIGRLFSYTLHKIPHRSNIWFRFHPHFPITIWLAEPDLSFLLKTVTDIYWHIDIYLYVNIEYEYILWI